MRKAIHLILLSAFVFITNEVHSQSIAREWNEVLLESIRNDQARPTVHARNLFHVSAAMYDAWAAYDNEASTYFLSHNHRGYYFHFDGTKEPNDLTIEQARKTAISYAAFRLILHRFQYADRFGYIESLAYGLMNANGFDPSYEETADYQNNPADLGNYIAQQIISFGLGDGSNEAAQYENRHYEPVNEPFFSQSTGVGYLAYPNRWQPLSFEQFIGQSGIDEGSSTPAFVSAEWGQVVPFALTSEELSIKTKDGKQYFVYYDPGHPAYIDLNPSNSNIQDYQWGFGLVAQWSSLLDPSDSVRLDISPATIGNLSLSDLPKNHQELKSFYDFDNGGDKSQGYVINPITNSPYQPQLALRADYARVLAEFWADGPDSETPPGHWFVILNYVNDHPAFEPKYKGQGEILDELEWNVKSYFALGGAVHDAAIAAWGIKGYYDYIRPISAIRSMAERGQSSNPNLPNYHPAGLPLIPNKVELISATDPLNPFGDAENEIKIKAWKVPGQSYPGSDELNNVDWILGTRWQPYQRPTFVTPPFAGYVSGHSTFSRAAAEMLSDLTGSQYFPGGMGEFEAPKNNFLVFETGPSEDLTLQWAKYQDASDQCSLSRIWGGIHPPVDDIPGRLIGYQVGKSAFAKVDKYFKGEVEADEPPTYEYRTIIGPNPVTSSSKNQLFIYFKKPDDLHKSISIYNLSGDLIQSESADYIQNYIVRTDLLPTGLYHLVIRTDQYVEKHKVVIL